MKKNLKSIFSVTIVTCGLQCAFASQDNELDSDLDHDISWGSDDMDALDCDPLTGEAYQDERPTETLWFDSLTDFTSLPNAYQRLGITSLQDLADVANARKQYISFGADDEPFCDKVLSALSLFHYIDFSEAEELRDEHLAHFGSAKGMNLFYCRNITDAGLAHLSGLQELNITMTKIAGKPLAEMTSLRDLNIESCTALQNNYMSDFFNALGIDGVLALTLKATKKDQDRLPVVWQYFAVKESIARKEREEFDKNSERRAAADNKKLLNSQK